MPISPRKGVSIIYVSHKMDEVFRVCETATILRDGRKVIDVVMKDTSESAVIARMVGRELAAAEHKGFAKVKSSLRLGGFHGEQRFATLVSNSIVGEVLGISGLVGAGRTELLRLIAGVDQPEEGEIRLKGAHCRLAIRVQRSPKGSDFFPKNASGKASLRAGL